MLWPSSKAGWYLQLSKPAEEFLSVLCATLTNTKSTILSCLSHFMKWATQQLQIRLLRSLATASGFSNVCSIRQCCKSASNGCHASRSNAKQGQTPHSCPSSICLDVHNHITSTPWIPRIIHADLSNATWMPVDVTKAGDVNPQDLGGYQLSHLKASRKPLRWWFRKVLAMIWCVKSAQAPVDCLMCKDSITMVQVLMLRMGIQARPLLFGSSAVKKKNILRLTVMTKRKMILLGQCGHRRWRRKQLMQIWLQRSEQYWKDETIVTVEEGEAADNRFQRQ